MQRGERGKLIRIPGPPRRALEEERSVISHGASEGPFFFPVRMHVELDGEREGGGGEVREVTTAKTSLFGTRL